MKITELAQTDVLNDEDVFPVVQDGETKKVPKKVFDENVKELIKEKVPIDTSMSDDSENPVQNKVMKAYVDDEIKKLSDTEKTIFEVTTTAASQRVNLRPLYTFDTGITHIDWGDGEVCDEINNDNLVHYFTEIGTYKITVTGLTTLGYNLLSQSEFFIGVTIGSIVTEINHRCFFNCPNIKEVTVYAETPPPIVFTGSDGTAQTPVTSIFGATNIEKVYIPQKSVLSYIQEWSRYSSVLTVDSFETNVFSDLVVTVGETGDFTTINAALEHLSAFYPVYKSGGISCEIKILDGTVIDEQIKVEKLDLSYITITTDNADNTVQVTCTDWTGITHDTRGNKPFFSGENGARLPVIKCLFSCITESNGAVGYFCNRGSTGVIAGSVTTNNDATETRSNVGFEGFNDNIIANNNSEIVLREAIARNAIRYGVHARHISRISARSADITGCGAIGAYADRASMLDVRHADISNCAQAIAAYHVSTITANETTADGTTGATVVESTNGSNVNANLMNIDSATDVFVVKNGGNIISTGAVLANVSGNTYNTDVNTLTATGVIYS